MEGAGAESNTEQPKVGISTADAADEISNAVIAYLPRFYRIALGRLGNAADAEDAVQDALLLAWKNIRQFKGKAHISTWICAIVINSTRLTSRKRRHRTFISLDDQGPNDISPTNSERMSDHRPDPEELCRRWELAERAIQLSHELSPMLRKTFELRDVHGLSVEEAANILGIKRNTVKVRTSRARAALRWGLEQNHRERQERV